MDGDSDSDATESIQLSGDFVEPNFTTIDNWIANLKLTWFES